MLRQVFFLGGTRTVIVTEAPPPTATSNPVDSMAMRLQGNPDDLLVVVAALLCSSWSDVVIVRRADSVGRY
jgi:hypothetical protein